jgi:hypothetical protein
MRDPARVQISLLNPSTAAHYLIEECTSVILAKLVPDAYGPNHTPLRANIGACRGLATSEE